MRVLLVDHDSEGLEAISRAIRGVLELDCVTSKGDALLLLRQNTYDVLIACERCVDGSGLDLLGRTTRTAVPLKRIFAAAPDRLQLLGPRLAPFKVQRTIAYPIDLEELWLAIAQVTGTNDETDGTIERVVLDERGIPANGSTPRAPIPPRPPAPLREVRVMPAPLVSPPPAAPAAPVIGASAAAPAGRAAAARLTQPAPEPPLRAPPPPRQPPVVARTAPPAATSDTGRMRALASVAPPAPMRETVPSWVPEISAEDEFAQVAEAARLGVQRKVVDEAARRKKRRLLTASAAAVVVAAVIVVLIEQFYDPEARARERAIAAEMTRMAEQQKVTDNLLMIQVDIEKAITENNLDLARSKLASLVEQSPSHPRIEFLRASIDRAAELARLASRSAGSAEPERATARPAAATRTTREPEPQPQRQTRAAERATQRGAGNEQTSSASRTPPRVYGAPIGEAPRQPIIPLDAPINAPPTTTASPSRSDNAFAGRTIEAGDASTRAVTAAAVPTQNPAGSAAVQMPPASTPAQSPPPAIDVVPAKLVRRVTPVVSADVPRRAKGFVVVQIDITRAGRVSNVEVVESSPPGVFDASALTAVRKWLYEPRKENGVAVESQARARLVFEEQ